MMDIAAFDRRTTIGGALLITGAVAMQAFTGVWLWMAVPFAILFGGALIAQWKTAWWVMLACIPPSVQIYFLDGALSTSVPDEPVMMAFLLLLIIMVCARRGLLPGWFL